MTSHHCFYLSHPGNQHCIKLNHVKTPQQRHCGQKYITPKWSRTPTGNEFMIYYHFQTRGRKIIVFDLMLYSFNQQISRDLFDALMCLLLDLIKGNVELGRH